MANRARIIYNDKQFKIGLKRIALKQVPAAAQKGMGMAALQLMGDCILVEPTVPLKTGRTRGSGTAFTQNRFVGDSQEHVIPREGQIKGRPTPDRSFKVPMAPNSIVGVVLFNTEYAWKIHELQPRNWQKRRDTPFVEPSSDIKWMETKLVGFGKQYFGIIAKEIKTRLGGK